MKKLIVFIAILAMSFTALVSCESKKDEKEYTLHLGVKASIDPSAREVSETVASVVTDSDGKIVHCRIDVIVFTAQTDTRGEPVSQKPMTKRDLGEDYGMDKNPYVPNTAGEWYVQANYFESFVEGMTLDEVKAIGISNVGKPTDADLVAGCTIAVPDFVTAVVNALEGTNKYTFKTRGEITSAVSAIGGTEITYPKITVDEKEVFDYTKPTYAFKTDFAAVVSAGGRVVSAAIDSMEVKMKCSITEEKELVLISAPDSAITKFELGDNYGMDKDPDVPNTAGEWYVQATAVAECAVGYETKKLSVYSDDLVTGCTMYADGYKAALVKAAEILR